MNNEIITVVKAKNDTKSGLDGARKNFDGFSNDVVKKGSDAGSIIGKNLFSSISTSLSSVSASGGQVLAGIGVIAAPTIAATLSAAVLGGAGIGGVLGGVALVKDNEQVKSAGQRLSKDLLGDLKESAGTFVKPVLEAIEDIRQGFGDIKPTIDSIFKNSAELIKPLTTGFLGGVRGFAAGLKDAVANSKPVIEAFGRVFHSVGDAVGDLFTDLSDNALAGAGAIDDLNTVLVNTIEIGSGILNFLVEFKQKTEEVDQSIDSLRYKLEDKTGWDITADGYEAGTEAAELYRKGLIGAAGSADDFANYQRKLGEKLETSTDAIKDQQTAFQKWVSEIEGAADPALALLNAMDDVTDSQNNYTEAVKKFGRNSPEAKKALRDMAGAASGVARAAADAGDKFDGRMTPAMRTMYRNAGLTEKQIRDLEKQLRTAKNAANNWEGNFTQTYTVKVKGRNVPVGDGIGGLASGGIKGAASGMIGSGLTWVGEAGPELMEIAPGTQVHSAGDSQRKLQQAMRTVGAGNGSEAPVVHLIIEGTGILKGLQEQVRVSGGISRVFVS